MDLTRLGNDLIADAREMELPLLVYAHPASGTQWLADQLQYALGGQVAHENLRGVDVSEYSAVVTFKNAHHAHFRDKFGTVVGMVRDPLKVIASACKLTEASNMRGMILASFFGDGLPYGYNWAEIQQQPWHKAPISTLLRWYELLENFGPPIYRIEDAKQVTEVTRVGKKALGFKVTWDEIFEVNGRKAYALLERARLLGYDTTCSIGGV